MALLAKRREKAWADAKAAGAGDTERRRIEALFHADVIADMYRQSQAGLRVAVPEQRHTSAVTADHAEIHKGNAAGSCNDSTRITDWIC